MSYGLLKFWRRHNRVMCLAPVAFALSRYQRPNALAPTSIPTHSITNHLNTCQDSEFKHEGSRTSRHRPTR